MTYRVVWPYATIRIRSDAGVVLREFYAGAVVPDGAHQGDVDRLLRKGAIVEVEQATAVAEAAPSEPVAPRPAQPKEDWVTFAVSRRPQGVSEEAARAEAEAKTKADLVAEYGG